MSNVSPAELGQQIDAATTRLLGTAAALTDEQVRQASPLPGWSRGHVLTHLARNADGLRNLLIWARTGVHTPQYASQQARDAEIEAGAGRTAAALLADLTNSAAEFAGERDRLSASDWDNMVQGLNGPPHPASFTLRRRQSEVEIHHVDLDAGYRPADWPAEFVADMLPRVADDFSGDESPPARLLDAASGEEYLIGPVSQDPAVTVTGPGHELLGWLLGRCAGTGLATTPPAAELPGLPSW